MMTVSCTTHKLPAFTNQVWHVDPVNGNAMSSSGLEFAFGLKWMITDTTLIQNATQLATYPKLEAFLAQGIAKFPEIAVDSIYFYNPNRGLLFATYHDTGSLKPSAEISLYHDSVPVYSKDYARIFGVMYSRNDDSVWEKDPVNSVYTNIHFRPKEKQVVILQRIPYKDRKIAVFHICATRPKRGKWWNEYPRHTFWNLDLGNTDNIDHIASFLHSARTVAVANLQLANQ